MIEPSCQPAAADGFDDPGFVGIGYEEGVIVAAEIVRPGGDGGTKLAVLLDEGADQLDGDIVVSHFVACMHQDGVGQVLSVVCPGRRSSWKCHPACSNFRSV